MASTDPNDAKRRLAELREEFIKLRGSLDRNIKDNQETLAGISNLNYHIGRLLDRAKKHFAKS